MNEDKPSLQNVLSPQINKVGPEQQEHPLHMLDNQADPETKPKVVIQKQIRTFESDMAEVMAKKNTSVASIAIAEQQRRNATNNSQNQQKTNLFKSFTGLTNKTYSGPPIKEVSLDMTNPLEKPPMTVLPLQSEPQSETQQQPLEDYSEPNHIGKKIFIIILSIILIVGGLGGGYYLYSKSVLYPDTVTTAQVAKVSGLFDVDSQKILSIGNLKKSTLNAKLGTIISSEEVKFDKVTEFILIQNQASTTAHVTGPNFIDLLGFSTPDILQRSLIDNWMFGIYGDIGAKAPFIILKTNFFQNAFAGMLRWESTMPDELSTILNYKSYIDEKNSQSTSTLAALFSIKGKFIDTIISNRDVREFITDDNKTLLLYSFVDKDTLVITTSENSLANIIKRLEKQPYVR